MKRIITLLLVFCMSFAVANAADWGQIELSATVEAITMNLMVNGQSGEGSTSHNDCKIAFSGITPMNQAGEKLADTFTDVYYQVNTLAYDLNLGNTSGIGGGLVNWTATQDVTEELPLSYLVDTTTANAVATGTGTWVAMPMVASANDIASQANAAGAGNHVYVWYKADFTNATPGTGYGAALSYKLELQ